MKSRQPHTLSGFWLWPRKLLEVKQIRDQAEAVLAVADTEEMREKAMELYLRSRRRRGELLKEAPKNPGAKGIGTSLDSHVSFLT